MPIPTLITDLSTTAASNYPAGSDSPANLDDVQRAHAAFIAQLRDDAEVLDNGLTTQLLVGGGAEVAPVWTTATGSGAPVRATSPVLETPALGTPSALVATNATGTATGLTAGISNALKSATTTVSVSAATAPTVGQVLTATSASLATWQTVSSSSAGASIFLATNFGGF